MDRAGHRWRSVHGPIRRAWIGVEGGDLPCQIWIRLGRPRKGPFCLTGIQIGAPDGPEEYEVTARMLRDIRLGNVLRAIREGYRGVSGTVLDTPEPGNAMRFTLGEIIGSTAAPLQPDLRVRRGRKGLDPETLRRTAETYGEAVREGSTQPLAVAAQRLDIHPSTVWRRLQNAWKASPKFETEGGRMTGHVQKRNGRWRVVLELGEQAALRCPTSQAPLERR